MKLLNEDYLAENEFVNSEKLKMSDIMAASMPQDENVNFYLSDEHVPFGYGDFYAYLIINHPKLGQFMVSVSTDGTDVRIDGRPWDFLQRPRHKLSNEQIEYIKSIKDNLKFIKLIESDTPRFTDKDFEGGRRYVNIGNIDRDKRVDVILSDDKIRPHALGDNRGFDTRLAYNFKNPYPAGKESLPIKVLKILKEKGDLSRSQINEILGKPATYYSDLFKEMVYAGFIDKVKEGKSAVKYTITDAGLKYLNNAKRKA